MSFLVAGPPGPPEGLVVTDITDTTVQLSWGSGPDNHSPVTKYMVQARTPFSIGWQTVRTGTNAPPPSGSYIFIECVFFIIQGSKFSVLYCDYK